jgi:serine phosphatase RsbU (regulator of sigma subunit)
MPTSPVFICILRVWEIFTRQMMSHSEHTDRIHSLSKKQQQSLRHPADFRTLARQAEAQGDWKAAANLYALAVEQRTAELALINRVQEGLSSRLEMQAIYDLVGDSLRDTFNAQVVMISQYDPFSNKIYHHYAIERGEHLHIPGWHPIDSSRLKIVRTGKPFMINLDEIIRVVEAGKMQVIPGTELPKTWMGVPMLVGNEVKGIVSLQNLDRENAFSPSDIDLLTTLTNSMTLSLENARLFNETQRLLIQAEQEMTFARQIQQSILPTQLPVREGYDFGALIVPARAVGGDFYDFIHLGDEKVGIVIGDVSDKGLPAALVMAMTFGLIRAETGRARTPCQMLCNVNRQLIRMNANSMFATLLYCILDCSTGQMATYRAGHLPPILIGPGGEVIDLAVGEGQSLGIFDDVKIDEQEVTLPPGGLALFYSDGLTEAIDAQNSEFGPARTLQELAVHCCEPAQAICEELWRAVRAHSGDFVNQDDFTTLVIKRVNGRGPHPTQTPI